MTMQDAGKRFRLDRLAFFFRGGALGVLLLLPGVAFGQQQQEEPVEASTEGTELSAESEEVDFQEIEDLLLQDEAVLSDPETYSYDPGTRRDPFRSLIANRREADNQPARGERPEGKAGLLIDEITLEGIFMLPEGPVAQVQTSDQATSYLIRPNDELWDGDVVSITLEEVVFKQAVEDKAALRPFREVVKRLN